MAVVELQGRSMVSCEEAVRDPIVVFVISSIKEDVELLLLRN